MCLLTLGTSPDPGIKSNSERCQARITTMYTCLEALGLSVSSEKNKQCKSKCSVSFSAGEEVFCL